MEQTKKGKMKPILEDDTSYTGRDAIPFFHTPPGQRYCGHAHTIGETALLLYVPSLWHGLTIQ
jgi:hypothetical protein